MDGVLACDLKGPRFNSQSRHMPGLHARAPLGACKKQPIDVSLFPSLSAKLPGGVSPRQMHSPWALQTRGCDRTVCSPGRSAAPLVLAQGAGPAASLRGAAFLAVKADRALCHSRGAVLPNCLFSTTLSSISLLTAPLQSENANEDQFSGQISGNHTAPGTTRCESL